MNHVPRRLAFIGLAILLTLAAGTIGFAAIEHYTLFQAFYVALTTMTTVGSKEAQTFDGPGRIFHVFFVIFGVTIMFLAVGAMTQTIIELEFNHFFQKRRIKRMIDKMQDHFILCGWGRVGRSAANELQRVKAPFVVVDNDEDRVESAIQAGMVAVFADATRDETLRGVGIDRARGLIATLATDADNLFLIISAKTLNSKLQLTARVSEDESEQKMRRAGADFVFAPYTMTGHHMAQALLRPHVLQFLEFTNTIVDLNIAIEQVQVSNADCSLSEMKIRQSVVVLAVRKASGEMMFNPASDAGIRNGDHLIVMGKPEDLREMERLLTGAR
jgi:voltage-gated potassium channel